MWRRVYSTGNGGSSLPATPGVDKAVAPHGDRSESAEADLRDVLPHISVPTLLLCGGRDVRAPLNVAEDLHAQIPGSRLVVIPDVGHMVHVEAAARFNAEVRDFLRSNKY